MNHRNSVGKGVKGHEKCTKDSKGAAAESSKGQWVTKDKVRWW